jgi:hypothetical protein
MPRSDHERFGLAHWPYIELHESNLDVYPDLSKLASAPGASAKWAMGGGW